MSKIGPFILLSKHGLLGFPVGHQLKTTNVWIEELPQWERGRVITEVESSLGTTTIILPSSM